MAFRWTEAAVAEPPPAPVAEKRGFTPSVQQAQVFDWVETGEGNAIIVAVAGAGKTTTLIEACTRMRGRVAMAAYNKRIADEIKEKIAARGMRHVDVGTFHSFGFRAWRKLNRDVRVDGRKLTKIMKDLEVPRSFQRFVGELVSLAKQAGVAVDGGDDDVRNAMLSLVDHYGLDEYVSGQHQEENLMYVAATRAKADLFIVEVE